MPSARDAIRDLALAQGFDAVGFAPASAGARAGEGLKAFLAAGHHGDMGWLETRADERADPQTLWPEAKSAVVLGLSYAPADDPLAALERRDRGTISVYAQNNDYHDVIKKRLKAIGREVVKTFGGDIKVFVDTAPVMEKPLAQSAGLGWQGKHTNLVSREHGSWLFLGVILTTLDLEAATQQEDLCGTCSRCLDICPTKAFPAPYKLDARRCISYLTIEHKGPIPRELRALMGNRIYGCDDCLAVCPWNKFAASAREAAFFPRVELKAPLLAHLAALDDKAFREVFKASPVKRIGRDRFVRNVLIAIGNSGDTALGATAQARLADPSPLVRGAAIWALSRLLVKDQWETLRTAHAPSEKDTTVIDEWRAA
ncbi:MAG: tRNA epoxyqueuosine(34) reductase QueG [Alphaproteobacteria bacterium]|nr:tRNA epoxyqueuosine(34) reductase QueG [Alphaproteobacteria bacterium]